MGFYSPATIVKDAQRHGLKVLPVDVTRSEWLCTLERAPSAVPSTQYPVLRKIVDVPHPELTPALRMGLRYVRGLREEAARSLLLERIRSPFTSIHDLTRRVPELRKDELTTLAEIGALNAVASTQLPVASSQ